MDLRALQEVSSPTLDGGLDMEVRERAVVGYSYVSCLLNRMDCEQWKGLSLLRNVWFWTR